VVLVVDLSCGKTLVDVVCVCYRQRVVVERS